jgi:hypothetical protein
METLVMSRTSEMVQPGAPLDDESDERQGISLRPDETVSPASVSYDPFRPRQQDDVTAREIRWACEWWPPDP